MPGDTNASSDIFVRDRTTGTTARVSVDSTGTEANSGSTTLALSADGRFVAFSSLADNLVPGDPDEGSYNYSDIFVHDRQTGTTERVNLGAAGKQADADSVLPALSADGRFVAFLSYASNLVPDDTNGKADIFVYDRQTGTTERVSVGSAGAQANEDCFSPTISADGRFVAFSSPADNLVQNDTNGTYDVFVHDRQAGTTERISADPAGSHAHADGLHPAISADGRLVAFSRYDYDVVPADGTYNYEDIFVYDRQTDTSERVSVGSGASAANAASFIATLSANGKVVAFSSAADNLVRGDTNQNTDVFIRGK